MFKFLHEDNGCGFSVSLTGPGLTKPFAAQATRWLLLSRSHRGRRWSLVRARPPACSRRRAETYTFPWEVPRWPVRLSICLAELIVPKPTSSMQRESREFPHTRHPASSHVDTFRNHGTLSALKTRRDALCFKKLQTLLGRHQVSHCCHCFIPGSNPGPLVTFAPFPPPPAPVCDSFPGSPYCS